MWKGRFQEKTTDLMKRFGESVSFDWRLYRHDIRASIAHARGLARAGVLTEKEAQQIAEGLEEIEAEISAGNFRFDVDLEDIHMNIEKALTERIGAPGAKLHTARSRNDQVAVDMRLYALEAVATLCEKIRQLQRSLVRLSRRYPRAILPGYTHLQRGQPVLLGHHLLAYVEMLERDLGRFHDARRRIDCLPLGSGALAGSTIFLDRDAVAEDLGFSTVSRNSMDAVSDRDFMAELLFALALVGTHLSRLSEDVILWVSAEFDFLSLSDAHTTGSSLMPQKKNPDAAELTRGKTGRLYGNLMALLTTLKGLPMTYNRDLQEDKERLFDSVDTVEMCLAIFAEMMDQAKVNEASMRKAASDPLLLATDLADYLVKRGVPFRKAHEVIGKLTAYSLQQGKPFPELTLEEYRRFSDAFEASVFEALDLETALAARQAVGSPSPQRVGEELDRWTTKLGMKPAHS